jgi:hypothetical protein
MPKQSIENQLLNVFQRVVKLSAWSLGTSLFLSACSSQQLYNAGQAWQQNQCNKMEDATERNRCMASAKTSYDDYQREAEAAKK